MNKKLTLTEVRQIVRKVLMESQNIQTGDYGYTINKPIIGDAIHALEQTPDVVKFTDKNQFEQFLNQQKYFSASYSHCYYSPEDLELSYKGDAKFRNGSSGVSEADRGCVLLFNTGHNLVAAWDESQKVGYILPQEIVKQRNR